MSADHVQHTAAKQGRSGYRKLSKGGTSILGIKLKRSGSVLGLKLKKKKRADRTLFCRYELKYRITEAQACAAAEFVRHYLHVDRYCKLQPDGQYPISSLYLDSEQLTLCRETIAGKKNRFKLRVRGYSDEPDSSRFFEIKRRINNVILKSRARVTDAEVATLIAGERPRHQGDNKDERALKQFQLYIRSLNAKPMVNVRYMRQAFEGDSDNRVRVTFDRQLYYKITHLSKVELNGTGWQKIPMNFVILEIKFTANYPAWLSRMIKTFNFKQTAMSKYVASIKQSCHAGFNAPRLTL